MTKNSIKTLVLGLLLVTAPLIAQTAYASTSISISPASMTVNPGVMFKPTLNLSTTGDKVCTVKGTLVFNNLTCKNITLENNLIAETSATCSNPNFLIGIPNCTTSSEPLFTIGVSGVSNGPASVTITSADIIGEGVSVGSAAAGATFNVIPAVITATVTDNNSGTSAMTSPTDTGATMISNDTSTDTTDVVNQPAGVAGAAGADMLSQNWFWILWLIIFILLAYIIYKAWKDKQKPDSK